MTVATFKNWYLVHKWTSLICTIFLLLLCLTGLPLVFREELAIRLGEAVETPHHVAETAPVTLDALIKDAQARRPEDHIKFLIRDEDQPAWFVSLSITPTAPDNSTLFMYDARTSAFLHDRPVDQGILNFLLKLHIELLAGLPGHALPRGQGIIFLASVVSDVVVYGPFMRKLAFGTIRQDGSRRLTWLDLHNMLGIVTVLWVFVVGATGVINTLDRPLLAYWQQTELAGMLAPWTGKPAPTVKKPVDEVVQTAHAAAPDMVVRFVAFPGTLFATPHHYMVFMRGQTPLTSRLLRPVLIDAETAQLTHTRSLPWYLTFLVLSQTTALRRLRRDAAQDHLGIVECHHDCRLDQRALSVVEETKHTRRTTINPDRIRL